MDEKELLEKRKNWYSQTYILMELVKCLKNKELTFIGKRDEQHKVTRYLIAFSVDYLKKHFERFDFFKDNLNMYHSCSYLKEIPIFSYNLQKRRYEDIYKDFNKNYSDHLIGYDLFFDFDGKENFELCYKEVKEFKEILENMKIPYYLLNSSFKGFHVIIPNQYFNQENLLENIKLFATIISNIKITYDFETLDDSIVDLKRVKKLPYSFVSDNSIALPLTDEQFNSFTPKVVEPKNVLQTIKIKERGLLLRTYGLSEEQLKANLPKFIEDFK